MKNCLLILIASFSFLFSSYSQKKVVSQKSAATVNPAVLDTLQLSEADRRKFDFFLFEGAREKMLNNLDNAIADYAQCYSINKYSPVVLYELARMMNTKIADNIAFMETAVKLEPKNIFYLTYLANLYFQVGSNKDGINVYIKIHDLKPEDDEFTYLLARTAGYLGDMSTSMKYFDLLENRLGINYGVSSGKIEVYEKFNKLKEGEKEYKKLIKAYPNNKEYVTMLGQYYMSNGLFSKALDIFIALSKDSKTAGEANLSLGLISIAKKDTISALNYFQKGLSDPELMGQRKMTYIKTLKSKDSYAIKLMGDRTIEFLSTVIKTNPDEVDAPLYLAFYYETDKKDNESACKYYKFATEKDPENYDTWKFLLSSYGANNRFKDILRDGKEALTFFPDDATILYYYGVACSIEGTDALAISYFEHALKSLKVVDGDNSALYIGVYGSLGDCYYRVDSVQKSFKAYEEVLKLNPNNVVVLNNYSYFLSEKGMDLSKAEQMSAKVIQLEPGNPTYLDTYAWVLFKLKRYSEAKFIIERAIDNGGSTSDVIVEHYGDILSLNGLNNDALKYWKQAFDRGSKSPSLPKKIEKGFYIE